MIPTPSTTRPARDPLPRRLSRTIRTMGQRRRASHRSSLRDGLSIRPQETETRQDPRRQNSRPKYETKCSRNGETKAKSKPGLLFGRWSVEAPEGERQRLIWWKKGSPGMGDLRIPWGPAHEDIHLIGHGWNVYQPLALKHGSSRCLTRAAGDTARLTAQAATPKPVLELMRY